MREIVHPGHHGQRINKDSLCPEYWSVHEVLEDALFSNRAFHIEIEPSLEVRTLEQQEMTVDNEGSSRTHIPLSISDQPWRSACEKPVVRKLVKVRVIG